MLPSTRPAEFAELKPADLQRYKYRGADRAAEARGCWNSSMDRLVEGRRAGRLPKFTDKMGRAAARKLADDNSVCWLTANPRALADVQFLAEQIGKAADETLKSLSKTEQSKRLADHFWCDVVGALVWEEVDGAFEKTIEWLADEVWSRVRCSRGSDYGGTPNGRRRPGPFRATSDQDELVADTLLKDGVKTFLLEICNGLWAKNITFDALILKLRIIAIWLCPDPLAHRLVWEHCWVPLVSEWIDEDALDVIRGVFPGFDRAPARGGP